LVTLTGGIITLMFAVLAFMASIQQSVSKVGIDLSILGSGPFTENRRGTERLLPSIAPNAFWAPFFIGALVVYLGFMYYAKSTEPLKEPTLVDKHRNERHWEMWVFLASETIFFSALIGSGIAYRLNNQDNWPDPNDVLNVNLTAINTFILIVSSYTMARGLDAIGKGEMVRFRKFLLFTILLGTSFVLIQASEYVALAEEGIVTLKTDGNRPVETASVLFSSGFYLQTGFHGAHVTVGVILLIFIYLRSTKGGYTKENHEYVEMVGLYWHFVDLVWIILFTILYLI
ncbi:MAG: heme-copper oxidase subunit III, partial [Candidatus Heimdallarchaeota archaeon]|nr:heme-copper oxidase subunit III [Candidatus Heimdallarchaeota archaeon]